jgi:hypothetical protein
MRWFGYAGCLIRPARLAAAKEVRPVQQPGDTLRRFVVPPASDGRIRRLFEYWRSIQPAPDRLPGRQHLEPLDVPELLQWLSLVDVVGAPPRFRYRLVGTAQARAMQCDLTGRWVDEAYDGFRDRRDHAEFVAVAGGEIRYSRGAPEHRVERSHVLMERLLLPLARDGASVDMILGIALYTRDDGTAA